MPPFSYKRASSLSEAAQLLADPTAQALGGSTDLLVGIDENISAPSTLVDLRTIDGSDALTWAADGGLRIGASARVDDVAKDIQVRERFPALAQACDAVGSPALRN